MDKNYRYIIIGAGLTGGSAPKGIREIDKTGSILLMGDECYLPYDRPHLSKKLWTGQKKLDEIFLHDEKYFKDNKVELALGKVATRLDPASRIVEDDSGTTYRYEKLLLATGGRPRKLAIPGGKSRGISYFRYLDDYAQVRKSAAEGATALVIGGGFIGAEIAAALTINNVRVTMLFPGSYILERIFPESLAKAIQNDYLQRKVEVLAGDAPTRIGKQKKQFLTTTREGREIVSDILIAGIGILPDVELAEMAGLQIINGIAVDEYLRSSDEHIFAGGDNTNFPYAALGKRTRIEHWDNAIAQGYHAGRNMAGASEPFTYMPYFFSDLFDFGFEAVGEIDSGHQVYMDWQVENRKGIIWYLKDGIARGLMMCNVWDKVETAREWIRKGTVVRQQDLAGALV